MIITSGSNSRTSATMVRALVDAFGVVPNSFKQGHEGSDRVQIVVHNENTRGVPTVPTPEGPPWGGFPAHGVTTQAACLLHQSARSSALTTNGSRPSPTFSDLLRRSVRQVNDTQKKMPWRTTPASSPKVQVRDVHVEDARKVGLAIVGNHHSGRSRIKLSVGHHSKALQAPCPAHRAVQTTLHRYRAVLPSRGRRAQRSRAKYPQMKCAHS
jgi:hypothetical protein